MSTEQMYVGKGNNEPSTEQTATTATQTAPNGANFSLSPDERQRLFYDAQTKLLDLVDGFLFEAQASEPIELLNDLLYHWLTTPAKDLGLPNMADIHYQNKLDRAFELVNFLAKANELHGNMVHFGRLATEVQHG